MEGGDEGRRRVGASLGGCLLAMHGNSLDGHGEEVELSRDLNCPFLREPKRVHLF